MGEYYLRHKIMRIITNWLRKITGAEKDIRQWKTGYECLDKLNQEKAAEVRKLKGELMDLESELNDILDVLGHFIQESFTNQLTIETNEAKLNESQKHVSGLQKELSEMQSKYEKMLELSKRGRKGKKLQAPGI